MRLFFGIQPDPKTCLAISDWRDRTLPPLNGPVPMANLHITTTFLGNVKTRQIEELAYHAESLKTGPIALSLDQLGYFAKPRILWLGPSECPIALNEVATTLSRLARRMGLHSEKREYRPHMTLARNCRTPPPASVDPPSFAFSCDELILFESTNTRSGVRYRAMASWIL